LLENKEKLNQRMKQL